MGAAFLFLFLFAVQMREMTAIRAREIQFPLNPVCGPAIRANDTDKIQFALNLEFLEAEFFLHGSLGRGLDDVAPYLTMGGPPPIGAQIAALDPTVRKIFEEFGYQEVGHLRAIFKGVGGFQRPLLDLRKENFAKIVNDAIGQRLEPPFDPYANAVNYLLASYLIPYVGLVGYVGTIPNLTYPSSRALVSGLLGVESGQDAVIRTLLYERQNQSVHPYNITVAQFTVHLSELRNRLAKCGTKDEGLVVPLRLGAENRTTSNILSADAYSLSYARSPPEILRIVYGSGDESVPGGFYPRGGNGRIARSFLEEA